MEEKDRILKNINGEIPQVEYNIVRVKNVIDPIWDLEVFQNTVLALIENPNLEEKDVKWAEVLPEKLVKFTEQLTKEDFENDESLWSIPNIVDAFRDVRDWEWYSSRLFDGGFEIIMKGKFRSIFLPLLHHQGIPHKNLFIENNGVEYPVRGFRDVLTHKTFDPDTFELK